MEVVELRDHLEHLDTITSWVWNEWQGGQARNSFEETRAIMAGKPGAPPTLLMVEGGQALGVLGFRRVMYKGREPLVLFINSLFVRPDVRPRGIGAALVEAAVEDAAREHDRVLVYTQLRAWYEARGFTHLETDPDVPESCVLFKRLERQLGAT